MHAQSNDIVVGALALHTRPFRQAATPSPVAVVITTAGVEMWLCPALSAVNRLFISPPGRLIYIPFSSLDDIFEHTSHLSA